MFKLIVCLVGLSTIALGAPSPKALARLIPMSDGRIVGGNTTNIETYPYTASVLRNNVHHCGGGIISLTWILSAAHCYVGTPAAWSIRVGSSTRNAGGQIVGVSRILIHASYNDTTIDFDIAVLELSSSINHVSAIPIALPGPGSGPSPGANTVVTGWGATSEGGALATILQVVVVPVVSLANCRAAYGTQAITDRMFCAGLLGVGGRDACQSDSGGPAVVNGLLTGIVSWGIGCARPNYPGVYTNVPNLRTWISSVTGI